jgi:hypothetical protein
MIDITEHGWVGAEPLAQSESTVQKQTSPQHS